MRNKLSYQLRIIIDDLNSVTLDFNDVRAIKSKLQHLFIESLEPTQRTVYHFIRIQFSDKPVTAADVAYAYHLQPNHAATILKSLYDLHLLSRQLVVSEGTRYYEYKALK